MLQRPIKLDIYGNSLVSEYLAIKLGLEEVIKAFFSSKKNAQVVVIIYSDSLPAVRHLNGEIAASKPYLEKFRASILQISREISATVKFSWVPKSLNEMAHHLAKRSHDVPPIIRNKLANGSSVEIHGDVAYIEGENGCYYRIDLGTFTCSCKEYSKKNSCYHCHQLRVLLLKGQLDF